MCLLTWLVDSIVDYNMTPEFLTCKTLTVVLVLQWPKQRERRHGMEIRQSGSQVTSNKRSTDKPGLCICSKMQYSMSAFLLTSNTREHTCLSAPVNFLGSAFSKHCSQGRRLGLLWALCLFSALQVHFRFGLHQILNENDRWAILCSHSLAKKKLPRGKGL